MAAGLTVGNLKLVPAGGRVQVGDKDVPLTRVEYEILATLVRNRNRVMSLTELAQAVWGREDASRNRLAVHISRIRKKIAGSSLVIRTVNKRGYAISEAGARVGNGKLARPSGKSRCA